VATPLNRLNTLLLALVVALAALRWWQPIAPTMPGNEPLSRLSAEQIQSITLQGRADEPFQLTRRGDHWWLSKPRQLPADALKIDALLALLDKRAYDRFAVPANDAAEQFIAAADRHWARFDQFQVDFGQSHPLGHRRYLRLTEITGKNDANKKEQTRAEIALVDDLYYHHLRSNWVDWVSQQPLAPEITLTRLVLPDLTLSYEPGAQSPATPAHWRATRAGASADELNQLVSHWQNLRATRVTVLPPDISTDGLHSLRIEWLDAQGAAGALTLYLQRDNRELLLHNLEQGVTYHFDPATAAPLLSLDQAGP